MMVNQEQNSEFRADPRFLIRDVYGYPSPEVRSLLGSLTINQLFFMGTLTPDEGASILRDDGYPDVHLESDNMGFIDLERIHEPVVDIISRRNEALLPGLSGFSERYANHGSANSIFILMADWINSGKMTELAYVKGEYDGYLWGFSCLGGSSIKEFDSIEDAGDPVEGRVWFISNPSAVNGNWHDKEAWEKFVESGHDIVYDAAFAEVVPELNPVDVSAPNIKAVITSPSKAFGVFHHRLTGIAYTREPVNSLIDTKVFKDVPALLATLMLNETFEPLELSKKYRADQIIICSSLSDILGEQIVPSDTILLATSDKALPADLGDFSRAGINRLGLKNQFELLERHNSEINSWYPRD